MCRSAALIEPVRLSLDTAHGEPGRRMRSIYRPVTRLVNSVRRGGQPPGALHQGQRSAAHVGSPRLTGRRMSRWLVHGVRQRRDIGRRETTQDRIRQGPLMSSALPGPSRRWGLSRSDGDRCWPPYPAGSLRTQPLIHQGIRSLARRKPSPQDEW